MIIFLHHYNYHNNYVKNTCVLCLYCLLSENKACIQVHTVYTGIYFCTLEANEKNQIEELGGEDSGKEYVAASGTVSADSTVAGVSSSAAVSDCVASHSNGGPLRPSRSKGVEEKDREEKSHHFHEADSDDIVVPPVALNSIEFQTHWKRLRRNKQRLAQYFKVGYIIIFIHV